jgi:DNA-binding transcriptional LysR family regulator
MEMMIMPLGNDSDLRLRDLRVLSAVLTERNLTRVAEMLDTSQPSISKVLARLRAHFGDPLVIRNGPEMRPTPRAIEMMDRLNGFLLASDQLAPPTPSFDPLTSDRVFKLLVTDVGTLLFLPPLVSRIANAGPRLGLRALPFDSRHFALKLETGEADLAIGAFPKASRGLRRQRLYFSGYLSVARSEHPKVATLRSRSGFRAAQHIMVMASDVGHAAQQTAQHALETEIAPERVLLRLSSFIAAAIVASRTDGVATIPANLANFFAKQLDLVTFRPSIPLPPIEITQYWHERYHRDPGHRWLRAMCFELFAKGRR